MPIPLSEVKPICTSSEYELVEKSRPPKLKELSLSQTQSNVKRARALFDKWQDLHRSQARSQTRKSGSSNPESRSQLKMSIFKAAQEAFAAHAAELESAEQQPTGKSNAATPKPVRAVEHRATRAGVRAELSSKKTQLNRKARASDRAAGIKKRQDGSAATVKANAKTSAEPNAVAAKKKAKKRPKTAATAAATGKTPGKTAGGTASRSAAGATHGKSGLSRAALAAGKGQQNVSVTSGQQRSASTAAKQSALARSGITSRVRGHVSARGKRSQGRRDNRS